MMDIHETTKEGAITGDNDSATDQAVNHEPKMASLTSLPSISVPSTKNLFKNKRSRGTQEELESRENPGTFDPGEGNSKRQKLSCEHWDSMFQQLVEYKEVHGDCLVPSRFAENIKLGKWVETQRYEHTKLQRAAERNAKNSTSSQSVGRKNPDPTKAKANKTRLTEERQARLESIGFEWRVKNKMKRYHERQWNANFDRLLKFKEEHGHVNVPKHYPPDVKLCQWVVSQRTQYRKLMAGLSKQNENRVLSSEEPSSEEGKCNGLTEERRKKLEDYGFAWENDKEDSTTVKIGRNSSYDQQWDTMLRRLAGFKRDNGHCLVPKRYAADPKLGTWCDTQRVQRKKLEKKLAERGLTYEEALLSETGTKRPLIGRLTDDRIKRLSLLGFVWNIRDDWKKHFEELKSFVKSHGHANVPARYSENRRLGIWVSSQRQQYKVLNSGEDTSKPKPPLTDERIALLNDLNFTWSVRSRDIPADTWKLSFEALQRYKTGESSLTPELASFIQEQRNHFKNLMNARRTGKKIASQAEERTRQLSEIGFQWSLSDPYPFKRAVPQSPTKASNTDFEIVEALEQNGGEENSILRQALHQVKGV